MTTSQYIIEIEKKLRAIKRAVDSTGLTGNMSISYSGIAVSEWDKILAGIKGFERHNHVINIADKTRVYLLLN